MWKPGFWLTCLLYRWPQNGGRPPLGFLQIEFFNGALLNFVTIGQAETEIWRFIDFFYKTAAVRHLRSIWRILGSPTKSTWWSLYRCAKFGWNRCSSFDNRPIPMFNILRVWLENAYSRPQNGGLRRFDSLDWQFYQRYSQKSTSYDAKIVKIGPSVFAQLTLLPNPKILCFRPTTPHKYPFEWGHLHPI